jgi:hypothetical protein
LVDRVIALAIFSLLAVVCLLAVKGRIVNRYLFTLAMQFRLHHLVSLGVLAQSGAPAGKVPYRAGRKITDKTIFIYTTRHYYTGYHGY